MLLVAVPGLSLMAAAGHLSDHEVYAETAKALKIPLHADGWSTVLADARLRADSVHANAAGYARFTDGWCRRCKAPDCYQKVAASAYPSSARA